MVFADEIDMHLLPKVGAVWMPQGTQAEVMTPGTNEKHSLGGALHLATGKVLYCLGPRKNNGLLRDLLTTLDRTSPAPGIMRISVAVDDSCMQKAKAVEQWLARHLRCAFSGCQHTVRGPTPLRACSAMGMTNAHGTTNENASAM
jgi:hypothetical protein